MWIKLFTAALVAVCFSFQTAEAALSSGADSSAPIHNQFPGETEPAVYIVQLADEPLATYTGGVPGLAATSPLVTGHRKIDLRSPASRAYESYLAGKQEQLISVMGQAIGRSASVRYQYRHAYNGLAVFLSPNEAAVVAGLDGVKLLYREGEDELTTDAGPAFINAGQLWGGALADRSYTSSLDGSQEVPPSGSSSTGTGSFSYNLLTRELNWNISHDISLANVTGAHIHSGAAGVNGPVEVALDHTVNPMVGTITLTVALQERLANQELYVNVHTNAFPGGEIRGQILPTGSLGEGVIVGIIDTGINSDHPSFAAVGGDGYAHVNPYGSGNYVGYCVANPSFCNDKLIGAWALHPSSTNPADANGHGSHTASTAAGNIVLDADLVAPTDVYSFDAVSGVAPHANIIAYQVCVPSCPTSSTTAAVNQAVIDGVDILNYSIGGGTNPYVETTAVAFLNAVAAGVVAAASAGNAGPGAGTVGHQGPWLATIGSSSHDRAVLNPVVDLDSDSGTFPDLVGESAAAGYGPGPLVYAGDLGNPLCDPFGGVVYSGEIVVCDRGVIGRVQKGANVLAAGGGGMILVNDAPNGISLNADAHVLPATHVSFLDGVALKAWMASSTNPVGRISGGVVDYDGAYADFMSGFSSRGPAGSTVPALANLIKPDLSVPGINILAAYFSGFSPPPEFNIISGTSMSSPHGAGAAALMRSLNPAWTPPEIKSALMLTATTGLFKEDGLTPGDAFDFGAGRIDLGLANQPGFVLDVTHAEFVAANPASGGDPRLLNLASMATVDCPGLCEWTRTLRSVLDGAQEYSAWIESADGIVGTVSPASFSIPAGGTQEITIDLNASAAPQGVWSFAEVRIAPVGGGPASAAMPVAVIATPGQPEISVSPESLESTQATGTVAAQSLDISNPGFSDLDWQIFEDPGVTGAGTSWFEDFDAYATGANLHGLGGWKGWDNDPAFTAFTSDSQAQSAPNSVEVVGSNDPVREFAGISSGQWTMRAWQYIPGAASGTSYYIMLNTYNDGGTKNWSVQVRFDSGAGTVVNDGISGGSLSLIQDQWVEIRVEIDLDADTQSFFYGDDLLYSGSWSGEVSGGGATSIGAINLFANSASSVYYDDLSLTGAECASPGSIPWVSVAPDSGTVAAGNSVEVEVTFDAAGLAPDIYEGLLCVTSNDPDNPLVTVPLTLDVVAVSHGVAVSAEDDSLAAQPGESVTYTVWVTNSGNVEDTFDIALAGNAWTSTPSMTSVTLPGGDSSSMTVVVDIPVNADDGDMDTVTLTATSQSDVLVSDSADLTSTATIVPVYGVGLSAVDDSLSGQPGESVTFTVWVTNTGNVDDSFDLETAGNSWNATASDASVDIAAGATVQVSVIVDVPGDAGLGDMDTVTLTATSQTDASASDSVDLTTTAVLLPETIFIDRFEDMPQSP